MRVGPLRISLVGAVLFLALSMKAEQPTDPADDPLPKGAKVRFGVTRPILRTGPAVALLPPNYTNFLAPTMTGGVRRYDLGTGRPLDKRGIVGPGRVVVSADGKRAAVARTGLLTVVEVATGKELLAVEPPEGVVLAGVPGVSLSADGKVLAYGGRGKDKIGEVVVVDVDKNKVLAQIETATEEPVFPTLARDGKTLATHGPTPPAPTFRRTPAPPPPAPPPDSARTAQVWEVASGKELFKARVTGMGGRVVSAAFSPDGSLVAFSAADGPIDLWEVKTGKRLRTLLGRKGQGVRLAISPDGKTVASVGPDYRIQRWTTEGKPLGVSDSPPGLLVAQVSGLLFADNERVIGWVTAAQFAVAWDAPAGKLLSPAMDHLAAINTIALPQKEKVAYTSGVDGKVIRWGLESGQVSETVDLRPARLPGQPLVRPVVSLSAEATRAVWLGTPTEVFDLTTGEDLFCVPRPSSPIANVYRGLSPDGLKLVVRSQQAGGKRSGRCVVWDLATQQRVAAIDIPPSVTASAPWAGLSPKGTRLVAASVNATPAGEAVLVITGYDLKTGKKLADVKEPGRHGRVTVTVADETSVVLVSNLGRVWSMDYTAGSINDDIEKVATGDDKLVNHPVVFSPDGKLIAVGVVGQAFTTYGVRVYDWPKRKALHTFIGHSGPVTALRFSADSKYLASGAEDTSVLFWDLGKLPGKR